MGKKQIINVWEVYPGKPVPTDWTIDYFRDDDDFSCIIEETVDHLGVLSKVIVYRSKGFKTYQAAKKDGIDNLILFATRHNMCQPFLRIDKKNTCYLKANYFPGEDHPENTDWIDENQVQGDRHLCEMANGNRPR